MEKKCVNEFGVRKSFVRICSAPCSRCPLGHVTDLSESQTRLRRKRRNPFCSQSITHDSKIMTVGVVGNGGGHGMCFGGGRVMGNVLETGIHKEALRDTQLTSRFLPPGWISEFTPRTSYNPFSSSAYVINILGSNKFLSFNLLQEV